MKKLAPILILLFMAVLIFSQIWVQYWGLDGNTKVYWGQYFMTRYDSDGNTYIDSVNLDYGRTATYLLGQVLTDTLLDGDTLFTKVLLTNGDAMEGIFNLTFSVDTVAGVSDGQADSIELWIRKYYTKEVHPKTYYSPWYQLGGGFLISDTLYEWEIADSSWWKACNGIQFKTICADNTVDTLGSPNLGPYIR